jgi:lipopolysaccharide assembly outer membrane protein LptD (OstA)
VTFLFLGETGAPLSRIDGGQALARFKEGNLLIDGKVSIAAGNRRLKAEQIILQPESGTIQVPGAYVLEGENGRVTGRRLITDLELNVPI